MASRAKSTVPMVWVVCAVRSPYGVPGQVRQLERTARVEHYLRVRVLWETVDPSPEPDDGGDEDGEG